MVSHISRSKTSKLIVAYGSIGHVIIGINLTYIQSSKIVCTYFYARKDYCGASS